VRVRDATREDAARCAEIYAPYVLDTAVSFETEPPGA
jgi:phosphinothricin acetyltransferase